MYRKMIVDKILATTKREMTTNELVEASGITKQGCVQMMHRLGLFPCRVEKARGPHGIYVWNMVELRRVLKQEQSLGVMKCS